MKKASSIFMWFHLLNKRLLKKASFCILLGFIPLLVIGINIMSKEESGILKIALYQENAEDAISNQVINTLLESESVLRFVVSSSEEEAYEMVQSADADAAWIFPAQMQKKIQSFAQNVFVSEGPISIVQREDNTALQVSREILFGALYPHCAYAVYEDFVAEELQITDKISEDQLREYYESGDIKGNLFQMRYLNGNLVEGSVSYLSLPIRGFLALMMVLCGLSMGLYFYQDDKRGFFAWTPVKRKLFWNVSYYLPGLFDMGVIVLIALSMTEVFTNWANELLLMVLYIFMLLGFTELIRRICGNMIRLGAVIPVMMILMLILCPIFLRAIDAGPIQLLIPPYYYLNAVNNEQYIGGMVGYIVIVYSINYILLRKDGCRISNKDKL